MKRELVCVLCAVDNHKNILSKVVGINGINTSLLHTILDGSIVRGSTWITDGGKSYQSYAENNYGIIRHIFVNSTEKSVVNITSTISMRIIPN